MHVNVMEILLIALGFFMLGIVLLSLAKMGILGNIGSGDYFFDFVKSLQFNNQTY